jgi:hypothetical protein
MSEDPARASTLSPDVMQQFRARLAGADSVVDPDTWAGSAPARYGIAPRVRDRDVEVGSSCCGCCRSGLCC